MIVAAGMLLGAGAAFAQPHAGDILLTIDGTSTINTGHINADGSLNTHERVFGTTLGVTFPNFTDNPGFDCLPGTFPNTSRNGFRILDALRVWDGTDFHLIPDELMEIAFSTLSVETPATPMVVEGFTLAVGSNGEWHRHLEYTLGAPADPGIYLLQLQIYSNTGTINPTQPFWMVFNQNLDQATLDGVVHWVKVRLAGEFDCGSADFNCDGDVGTDADIEAFFSCLAGNCPAAPCASGADFNGDGDVGTDADIEAFFRVLAGGTC
jgi:hypothetical protein